MSISIAPSTLRKATKRAKRAHQRLRLERRALASCDVLRIQLDAAFAIATLLQIHRRLQRVRLRILCAGSRIDPRRLDRLPLYALALGHAEMEWAMHPDRPELREDRDRALTLMLKEYRRIHEGVWAVVGSIREADRLVPSLFPKPSHAPAVPLPHALCPSLAA